MSGAADRRPAALLAFALPALLVGGALASQYIGGLYPCEMCLWQRWPHYAALGLAAGAILLPGARFALTLAAALAILGSGIIGAFHAGVEYGWWEGITTCAASGGGGLADIMAAPLVRCDVAPWTLIGISLAGYNALFSIGGAIAISALVLRRR